MICDKLDVGASGVRYVSCVERGFWYFWLMQGNSSVVLWGRGVV